MVTQLGLPEKSDTLETSGSASLSPLAHSELMPYPAESRNVDTTLQAK